MDAQASVSFLRSYGWAIPVAFILLVCVRSVARAILDPLRDVPGPRLARFTRFWYLRGILRRDFEKVDIGLHREHGPVIRIAPGQYSLDGPEAVRGIYSPSSGLPKSSWYVPFMDPGSENGDIFADTNSKRHAVNRRKVAGLYSMTSLIQMEPCVAECVTLLVERFKELAKSGKAFNLQHWLQCYAFDVIGLITLDRRFGFLDAGEDQGGLFSALDTFFNYAPNVGVYPEWHPLGMKLLSLLPAPGMSHLQAFSSNQVNEGQRKVVEEKYEKSNSNAGDSMLIKMLRMHDKTPEKMSLNDVITTCTTNVGAGSDTTSISIAALIYNLLRAPKVYQKLREEVDLADAEGRLSSSITFQETQKLPYLQACIKEALRIHPVTGLPLARVVPEGGMTLCGRYFPEGTTVGVNAWVIHHNKSIFGEDADVFRPERWLESEERSVVMERNFLTFGAGTRTCTGKNISLMEISKLIPELFRRFDFELADPNMRLQTMNRWFVKQKNLFCKIKMRQ